MWVHPPVGRSHGTSDWTSPHRAYRRGAGCGLQPRRQNPGVGHTAARHIRLWDVATGHSFGPPLVGHTSFVSSVAFSPDGTLLASAGGDGTILLWDASNGQSLGVALTGDPNGVNGVTFSPDGRLLATVGGGSPSDGYWQDNTTNNTVQLWDIDSVSLARPACQIANRNMTLQEWRQYLGDLPYQKTCAGLP